MKITNPRLSVVAVLTLSMFLFPVPLRARTLIAPASGSPQTRADSTARVVQLLQQSGFTSRKTGEHTWVIERPSKGKGWILAATGAEFVVLGIIVAVKQNMRVGAELNFRLLKLNHSLDYIKVGFDDDDDLFVRTEVKIRLMDVAAFRAMVQEVDTGANKTYEVVKPFLVTP